MRGYQLPNESGARCLNCNQLFDGYSWLFIPDHECKSNAPAVRSDGSLVCAVALSDYQSITFVYAGAES